MTTESNLYEVFYKNECIHSLYCYSPLTREDVIELTHDDPAYVDIPGEAMIIRSNTDSTIESVDVTFLDSIQVTSSDGTWSRNSLEPASFYNPMTLEANSDDAEKKFYQAEYDNAKEFISLYADGKLDGKGIARLFVKSENPAVGFLDICIRKEELPTETWEKLKANMPGNACKYSGTYPVANLQMKTFRDNGGCVGSSWENSLVSELGLKDADEIRDVMLEKGPFQAGLRLFEMFDERTEGRMEA